MKKLANFILFVIISLFLLHCTGKKVEKHEPVANKALYTRDAAMHVYASQPERALLIIDSAVIVGNLTPLRADILRAIVYSRSYEDMKYDSAILISERLMHHDSVKLNADMQIEVLEVLLNACRLKKDNEQAMYWATQLGDLYRRQGDVTEALRTDAEIGYFLIRIGQYDEGLATIDTVIYQLNGKRKFNELDASIIALKRKAEICSKISLYDKMISAAQRMLDLLGDYEKHPVDYHDGSIREPADEERPRYIDFYRGKAYAYMAEANASLGNHKAAKEYIALYENTSAGRGLTGRFMIAPMYGKLGDYDLMLDIYDEVEQQIGTDTINANYVEVLRGRAEAAEAKGRDTEAKNYWKRYAELREMLNDQLLKSKAHLYAARFHSQEQQREIERNHEAIRRANMMGVVISIVSLMVLLFAVFVVIDLRSTKKRNRILAFQITEASKYKEKYRELKPTEKIKPNDDDYADMSDSELFAYLRDVIECENLYLNPDFERQALTNRTGLSKERIAAAFAQGSDHETLGNFVRELRLEHAIRLMNENPGQSIEQVSQASGFAKADTFARYFKMKYGMTPTAYLHTKA